MERIRAERAARYSIPNSLVESKGSGDKKDNEGDKKEIIEQANDIDKLLAELKKNEPTSDNQFFRLSIIAYEMGDLHRSIVYAERFKNDPKIRAGHLANGRLALADALTQLYLLCMSLEWDFHALRKLGADHLAERHRDFERDGWSEIK